MTDPKPDLSTPVSSQVILVALAEAAKVFGVPTTITSVEELGLSGRTYPELLAVFPERPLLRRTSRNGWDDRKVRDALAEELEPTASPSGAMFHQRSTP